ncbi:4-hydroxy-tetrahydrodipicolinate reductase [Qingshengfaniella alkalisoli]|uniref:4-hydroxy-tetrahydrodipicolinate reductase n=1 Tax=Qingshengfaniella alkalisoli TaxID=2599296 RepID=A0A5B8IU48_9RHOB|nr:4-hydroxy-tetrahydrodipicolinate reductase [Qingshengfaniella alkalisoli]QDY68371.1 4-hydroxy-tetrahydrodipicolinate reductase [Qingshengfaniella alkalisoli]
MSNRPRIAITGVSGRMGQMLVKNVSDNDAVELSGAIERTDHEWVGQDVGVAMGGQPLNLAVTDDAAQAIAAADVVIDFTAPTATLAFAELAARHGTAHVIGTTGMNDEQLASIANSARKTAIVRAGNMSLGVNLLVGLTRRVAAALDEDFDIEVVEAHHRYKVDAPSGTALMLGEAAAEGRGVKLRDVADRGRDGITGARKRGDIGFTAIRGGDVVGEHDVIFAADGERIVIRHLATDRGIFSRGAVKAAIWAVGKPAGEYSMANVLGLE